MKNEFSEGSILLNKLYRLNRWTCILLERLGVVAGLVALIISFVDVAMYKLFQLPIQGSLDLVRFGLLIAIASMGSITLLQDQHLSIEFFITRFSGRAQAAFEVITSFFGMAVAAGVTWHSILYGRGLYEASERSGTIYVPLFPFAYVITFSFAVIGLVFFMRIVQSITEMFRDEE